MFSKLLKMSNHSNFHQLLYVPNAIDQEVGEAFNIKNVTSAVY